MIVSVILTVKNETESLPRLLDSLAAQTHAPDEIIVVDGGSTDTTLDGLRAWTTRLPLEILTQPGANISQGRNTAIRAARGEIICSTDAGVRLDPNWIAELVEPFDDKNQSQSVAADVVSGFFVPDPQTAFEVALAATTLPIVSEIVPEQFLPSSRSIAFRKSAWERVRGYPEWLDYCEDLIFDFDLRAAGLRFAFAPRAVAHFRPRENLRAFFKQYYLYARGDGKANLWLKRHFIRYTTYCVALPALIPLTLIAPLAALPLWLLAAIAMFLIPYRRVAPMLRGLAISDRLRAMAWIPIIRITGDVAKMIGYPVGVAWRRKYQNAPR